MGQETLLQQAGGVLERVSAEPAASFDGDLVRRLQSDATTAGAAAWGHWGTDPKKYSAWTSHSNRLIPIYTFGISLDSVRKSGSAYTSAERLQALYGKVPEGTLQVTADYFDQTDMYALQLEAIRAGKKNIVLIVFDGMDWQTTQAAAIYASKGVGYVEGRGTGLSFQDYRGTLTDYGYCVTSPYRADVNVDVDVQKVSDSNAESTGGFSPRLGGPAPWSPSISKDYLIGLDASVPHTVTDSASAATSLTAGIKTYNNGINVANDGAQVEPIAHLLQRDHGFAIGVVTSVPISHATPAAAYSHNVTRNDYQDLTRDLLGLKSISHSETPLRGADVVLGAGWGENAAKDAKQGKNFVPGNKYLTQSDLAQVNVANGGSYVVAERTAGQAGSVVLANAANQAIQNSNRLLGFFGVKGGHLPYRTSDGRFDPTIDVTGREIYTEADIVENPTLSDLTTQALRVLEQDEQGFWLMVEAGDVDWANHANNIDNSIGAVLSGDAAFKAVVEWIESKQAWDSTAVILSADHGHYFNLVDPSVLVGDVAPVTSGN